MAETWISVRRGTITRTTRELPISSRGGWAKESLLLSNHMRDLDQSCILRNDKWIYSCAAGFQSVLISIGTPIYQNSVDSAGDKKEIYLFITALAGHRCCERNYADIFPQDFHKPVVCHQSSDDGWAPTQRETTASVCSGIIRAHLKFCWRRPRNGLVHR